MFGASTSMRDDDGMVISAGSEGPNWYGAKWISMPSAVGIQVGQRDGSRGAAVDHDGADAAGGANPAQPHRSSLRPVPREYACGDNQCSKGLRAPLTSWSDS